MNIYSILDDSDNEEGPKKVAPKSSSTETKKGSAPKKDIPGKAPDTKKDAKKSGDKKPNSSAKGSTDDVGEGGKDNNRGGMSKGKGKEANRKPANKDKSETGGKRAFDRKSGTGRGREVSRGGRGPFNSGNDRQDAQNAEKDPSTAEVTGDDDEAGAEEPEEPAEPEPETFTMDQFMAKRNEARAKATSLLSKDVKQRSVNKDELSGLSKAGEELNDFWAQTKGLKISDKEKTQRSNSKQTVANVGFKFEPVGGDDRDDRGGRRGGSGRGGRGGDRDDNRNSGRVRGRGRGRGGPTTVFSTHDNSADFPAL